MRMTTKILMIFCIIVVMKHVSPAQNRSDSDFKLEYNKIWEEIQSKGNYMGSNDSIVQDNSSDHRTIAESIVDDLNRWQKESQKKDRLERQRLAQISRDNTKDPYDPIVQYRYTICMNRPGKYKLGEPIFIRDYVEKSGMWIWFSIDPPWHHLFASRQVSLVDADGNEVQLTRTGKQEDDLAKNGSIKAFARGTVFAILRLQNRNPYEMERKPNPLVLNHYFDLTRPGVYYLTFHRLTLTSIKQLDEPLVSNTLTFEVLDEFVTPEDLRDPGEFNWPPQDEKEPDATTPPAE